MTDEEKAWAWDLLVRSARDASNQAVLAAIGVILAGAEEIRKIGEKDD